MFDDIKKEIDDTLEHLNPFENICSDGYAGKNVLPSHVKKTSLIMIGKVESN